MILNSLELEYFRKHKTLKVDFTEGLNLIVGDNYTGKTTITHAILFAFGGVRMLPFSADRVATRGSGKTAKVVLTFTEKGTVYTLERTVKNATLTKGDEVIAKNNTAVSHMIGVLIGLDLNRFLKLNVNRQGESYTLLNTQTQELKNFVEALSGCDVIDRVQSKSNTRLKTSKDKLEVLTAQLDQDYSKSKTENLIQELEETREKASEAVARFKTYSDELSAKLSRFTSQLDEAKENNTRAATNKERIESNRARVQEASEELNEITKSTLDGKAIDKMREDSKILGDNIDHHAFLHGQVEASRESVDEISTTVEDLTDKVESFAVSLAGMKYDKSEHTRIEEQFNRAKERYNDSLALVAKLKSELENRACSECGTEFMKAEQVQSLESRLAEAREGLPELKNRAVQLKNDLEDHASRKVEYDKAVTVHEKYTGQLNDALVKAIHENKKLKLLKEQVQGLSDIGELKLQKAELDKLIHDHDITARTINSLRTKIDNLNAAYEQLDKFTDITDTEFLEKLIKEVSQTKESATKSAYSEAGKLDTILEKLKNTEEYYQRNNKVLESIESFKHDFDAYTNISHTIKTNRSKFMEQTWLRITQEASSFVHSCTSGDIESVILGDNQEILYVEGGDTCELSDSSGAQRSILSLGIRIGIIRTLTGFSDLLILDEVTADMDERVSTATMSMLSASASQIIDVSHETSEHVMADNLITL